MSTSPRQPRRGRRALVAGVGTIAIGVAGLGVAPAFAQPPAQPPATQPNIDAADGEEHDITLLTGDVVHIAEAGGITTVDVDTVIPGAGWQKIQAGDDLLVVPDAAMPFLAADSIDQDLFNVTKLIADGYDDASVDAIPLIVEQNPKQRSAPVPGLELGKALPSVKGSAASTEKDAAEQTWQALTTSKARAAKPGQLAGGITKVHLDGKVAATLDSSVPWIGAPEAWAAGFDGDGVTVAVLDTGVDTAHPDLKDKVSADSKSFVPGEAYTDDVQGHGTHVVSTVVGTGAASDGKNRGVADGADVLFGKVLGNDGYGQESWIISGMEWASQNAPIVSMSLGTQEPSDGTDVMSEALNSLTEKNGTLFIVAAGNASSPESVGSPGAATGALTVGSVDDPSGDLSWFSSQGPVFRSGALKPDIAGPGNNVTAARSSMSSGSGDYVTMSGTSMATPHVAGAAAILKQQHPDFTGAQLRTLLTSSTREDGALSSYQIGAGVLDVARAIKTDVVASGSGDFGMVPWGGDAKPVRRSFEYTNRGDAEVTVALDAKLVDATGDGGGRDTGGVLKLSADSLVVPAGETRSVTIDVDPAEVPAGARFTGYLIGSIDGEAVTRSALGVSVEAERYDLKVSATGLDGTPTSTYAWITSSFPEEIAGVIAVDGETTLRMPAGRYGIMSMMDIFPQPDAQGVALVGDPDVVLDGTKSVSLDARTAVKVTADVGDADAEPTYRRMDYTADGIGGTAVVPIWADDIYAQPQKVADAESFGFTARWRMQHPALTLSVGGTRLDVIPQAGAVPFDGRLKAKGVDVGTGTDAGFAGKSVKGSVAVATLSSETTPEEVAARAAKAGARMLVLINSADQEYFTWVGETAIPVAGISGIQGRDLIKKIARNQQIVASGTPLADEIWDIARYADGEIPQDLTGWKPKLARIDTRYYGKKGQDAAEVRVDMVPGTTHGTGPANAVERGTDRVDWVSTENIRWYQDAYAAEGQWNVRDIVRSYKPGQKVSTSYFGPVVRPYIGNGYWAPRRQDDSLSINIPAQADGANPDRTGALDGDGTTYTGALYADGQKVRDVTGQAPPWTDVPAGQHRLRYEISTGHDGTWLSTSTKVDTAWEFESGGDLGDGFLPMLQAYYGLDLAADGTTGANRKKGQSVPFTLQLSHLDGAIGSAPVKSATLEMRLPGGEWKKVDLKTESISKDGPGKMTGIFANGHVFVASFSARLPVPDAGGFIDLRVTGVDEAGNTVSQQIEKAVEVSAARGAK
ncbi:S8 family serine peptidase [Microbacterium sp. NPDC057659]|uniref:S8 family peptidase n=1 Tax=Microbacterium sp. NPDC057659 TaxID=3346198 RepID=UPI00366AF504